MKKYIKGNFRKSIFTSPTGYMVGLFKVRETNDDNMLDFLNRTVTFTGYFNDLNTNEQYLFYGEGLVHPKYDFQYTVSEYERIKPVGKDGIVEFLSSGLFAGIGEKRAANIVEVLGENALDLIFENPDNLLKVKGITKKKKDEIYNILKEYEDSHDTFIFLCDLGFNMKEAMIVYNKYKKDTKKIIESNIYNIYNDIEEITFEKIDSLREKLNIEEKDHRRLKALIIYSLNYICNKDGHSYVIKEELIKTLNSYLRLETNELDEIFQEMATENLLIIENEKYYLLDLWKAEHFISQTIKHISEKSKYSFEAVEKALESLEKHSNITYNDDQRRAIIESLTNKFFIISGGPGTGKSTIIKAIIDIYQILNKFNDEALLSNVALLAPTGRASKRLTEMTYLSAYTIHRFLKWNKENNNFAINEYNKTFEDLIIVDEVSMIDTLLLSNLFKGLTSNIHVIFVGDYNQLPSVGPGQILKDLMESDVLDYVNLKILYRQSENSFILPLARNINSGELDVDLFSKKDDFSFIKSNDEELIPKLINICEKMKEKDVKESDIQFLVPMYKGINGIDNLNKKLQNFYNPHSPDKNELILPDSIFREGDKVIQLKNDPDNNVFNGDLGIIRSITKDIKGERSLFLDFDGSNVKYSVKDLLKIKHGYAISIHKAQGSEFKTIIMPIVNSYNKMLYRKLIYTGVTRARENLIIIGNEDSFIRCIQNNYANLRHTTLKEILINDFMS